MYFICMVKCAEVGFFVELHIEKCLLSNDTRFQM